MPTQSRVPRRIAVLLLLFAGLSVSPSRQSAVRTCVAAFMPPARLVPGGPNQPMRMADWFANHPTQGMASTLAPVDSFLAGNFYFDNNGDGSVSQVDTSRIIQGQTVLWKWVTGFHTVTNGAGSGDPGAGLLFDQPLTSAAKSFSYQFNTTGTFSFFCRNHELSNMAGVVVVSAPLAVPVNPIAQGEGFVRPAWPNPSRGASTFRFALPRPGRARLSILDVQGRQVARLIDNDLGAGTFESAWDGLLAHGGPAAAGVYLARLEWPGRSQTQRFTLVR